MKDLPIKKIQDLSKEELIGLVRDAAKNWIAHDGLWFRAVEDEFGFEAAFKLDGDAWKKFTIIEAKRIMKRFRIEQGGGISALTQALKFKLYSHINEHEFVKLTDKQCIFRLKSCRVHAARRRAGLRDLPCKPIGIVEYGEFARAIDPRIKTICLVCPPDPHPPDVWCEWQFILEG